MKIISYKYLNSGKYKIKFDSEEHTIYEDVILKNSILTKKDITEKELESYLKDNDFYDAYYKSINYINKKLRSKLEIKKYLKKDYSIKVVNDVIEKLEKDGYLNEEIYVSAYINDQINLKIVGPFKIKDDLIKLGINEKVIEKHLENYTNEDQIEKIKKVITKEMKLNKNKSTIMLKNKILKSLTEKGFNREMVLDILESFSLDDSDILEKEKEKLYNKLSQKYSGKELDYKVKEKLYQKGFRI